jgi:BirA family biotin operon repressor/biotin-[acetyl-CoA-carboxylase] ligase
LSLIEITNILGYKVYNYDLVDSTNLLAKKSIDEQKEDRFLVVANQQIKGVGRNSREWVSELGNLFVSIVPRLRQDINKEIYSYIAALSVSKTLEGYGLKNNIKWPNDILVDAKKISGILLESHRNQVVIGIGVNIASHPDSIEGLKATNISEYKDINIQDFLVALLKNFKKAENISLKHILNQLEERLDFKNEKVTVGLNKKLNAKIIGLSENGALIIETEAGKKEINYGEISV